MRNDDMQDLDNPAHLVHNPHRDHMNTRRGLVRNRLRMYSRDRSRRT
jgi:hypothetical protein